MVDEWPRQLALAALKVIRALDARLGSHGSTSAVGQAGTPAASRGDSWLNDPHKERISLAVIDCTRGSAGFEVNAPQAVDLNVLLNRDHSANCGNHGQPLCSDRPLDPP